jgi:hypothetical protein
MSFSAAAMLVYGELEYDKPQDHRGDHDILRLVPLIEFEPDDNGNPYDADVTVELDDGITSKRSASDASRLLLYHDRPTASALFDKRIAAAGRPVGTGAQIAQALFECVDGAENPSCREFLRRLISRK